MGRAEKEVVEAEVAMYEALRTMAVGQPWVEALDEALAQHAVLRGDALAVALEETWKQLGDERLVDRARAVQPVATSQRRVAEHRCVQTGECVDRDACLCDAAARDLVPRLGRPRVFERQGEPTLVLVEQRDRTGRQWTADTWRQLVVEANLASVDAASYACSTDRSGC